MPLPRAEELSEISSASRLDSCSEEVFAVALTVPADRRGEPRPGPILHPHEIVPETNTLDGRFNGPSTPDEKAYWDMLLKRKATALEEIEHYKKKLKRPSKHKEFYEDEAGFEQKYVDLAYAFIPDVDLRRRPGFDIREWQKSNQKFQAVLKRRRVKKQTRTA